MAQHCSSTAQTNRRTARIWKAAGVLVFLAIAYGIHHLARPGLRDVSRLAVAHYRLPATDAMVKYAWLSSDEVIIGTYNDKRGSALWRFDLRSERGRELPSLTHLLNDTNINDRRLGNWKLDWKLGSEERLLVYGRHALVMTDLSGRTLTETGVISGLRLILSPHWLPGPKAWLIPGVASNKLTMGLVWSGGREALPVVLHTNLAYPIGGVGQSEIVFLEFPRSTTVTTARLIRTVVADEPSMRSRDILLPFECQITDASVSPNGRHILWELGSNVGFPRPILSVTFPFLRFRKSRWEWTVWVSNIDGTGFIRLGRVQGGPLGHLVQWHPDENKVSMIAGGELLVLDLPKKKELTSEPRQSD